MGCDHYLYMMRKPSHEAVEHAKKRFPYQTDLMAFTENEPGSWSLGGIGTWSKGFRHDFDYELLKKHNNIPADAELYRFRSYPNGEEFHYRLKDTDPKTEEEQIHTWVVNVSDEESQQLYETLTYEDVLYVESREVRYWRNDDKVRDTIRKYVRVENCDYHILTKEALDALCAIDEEVAFAVQDMSPEEHAVYHEWY